jgi:hypothetical protein
MCATFKGDVLKVKVPKTFALEITKIHDALNQNKGVFVTFTGLTLRAYAMSTDNPQNGVISGVVGNASDFKFRIEEDDDVDINIEL